MSPAASPEPADAPLLARRLLPHALAAFDMVPDAARGPMCAAIDAFTAAPAPSTFLAAFRILDQTRRRALIERAGAGVLRRSFDDGISALGRVTSLPPGMVAALGAHLSVDVRAGVRLHALAALAVAYQELSARVAADTDRRRRLWKTFPRRRPRANS